MTRVADGPVLGRVDGGEESGKGEREGGKVRGKELCGKVKRLITGGSQIWDLGILRWNWGRSWCGFDQSFLGGDKDGPVERN